MPNFSNYADQLDSTFTMPFAISDYVHRTGLLKQGYLSDLLYENGNGLAVFSPEPRELSAEESEALLTEFTEKYWPGEQQ